MDAHSRIPWMILIIAACGCLTAGCTSQPTISGQALNRTVEQKPWQFAGAQGEILTAAHYRLYTTSTDRQLTRMLCGFLEAARTNYAELTGLTPPRRTRAAQSAVNSEHPDGRWPVYLMATRHQWMLLTQQIAGAQAPLYAQIESGGYCHEGVCVFWNLQPLGTYSVAAHEGMHQFLHHSTNHALPVWAEEGLATLAEGFHLASDSVLFTPETNTLRFVSLRRAVFSDRLRSVAALLSTDAAENVQKTGPNAPEYYGQLWAMMLLIRQDPDYAEGLRWLLEDAAAGRLDKELGIDGPAWAQLTHNPRAYNQVVGPRAFAHYIDEDMGRFEQRYRAKARELAGLAAP